MAKPETTLGPIETERLVIRYPEMTDVPLVYQAVRESIAELQPYLPWATEAYSIESCEGYVQSARFLKNLG